MPFTKRPEKYETIGKLSIFSFYFSLKNKSFESSFGWIEKKFKQNLIFGSSMWAQYSNG